MQPEEPRTETEPAAEQDPTEEGDESTSERTTPPIDEDIVSSVNAAVPDDGDE
jgi:hypothetical protein